MNKPIVSGVSWLHDTLRSRVKERSEWLKEAIAAGVPLEEYRQMVGKYKETQRFLKITLPELFEEFYQADSESDDNELEELKDE